MNKRYEQYSDTVARLYPIKNKDDNDETKILSRPITFCVTNACQLRCTYCYEVHKGNSYMDFETAKKFIDLILTGDKGMNEYISVDNSPHVVLEFIGGEPFMAIDLINQIIEYWIDTTTEMMHPWATRFKISICSNGVAYFDKKVQNFLNKYKNLLSFNITIDGNKELHDSCRVYAGTCKGCYDEAIAGVKDWMSKGNYMGSKITLSPDNLKYMNNAIIHMVDLGYTEILANCTFEPKWSNEDAALFYKNGKEISDYFLKNKMDFENEYYCSLYEESFFKPKDESEIQNWCGGTGVMIACDWDGRIYPCIRFMEMSLGDEQPPFVIGDVDNGLMQTEETKKNVESLWAIDRRTQSTDECFYCPIGEGCAWCSGWNYQLYGTPDKRCTHICQMHKARALFNCYFWNKYYIANGINKRMKLYVPEEWALEIISKEEYDMLKDLSESKI